MQGSWKFSIIFGRETPAKPAGSTMGLLAPEMHDIIGLLGLTYLPIYSALVAD